MRLYREGYGSVAGITGPLLFLKGVKNPGFAELVSIETDEEERTGQILQVDEDICVVQVFDGTMGLDTLKSTVWLERDIIKVPVGDALIGQVLDGRGRCLDHKTLAHVEKMLPTSGIPINPVRRQSPSSYIETGISTIDIMNTLVKGQKLPIFSGAGLPGNQLAAQIVTNAKVPGNQTDFLVVFAAMGITLREADFFIDTFSSTGALDNGIFFMNLASDSAAERLLTPRMALTVAEYFAFEKHYDVLVVMTDMLYYSEALREISAAREEVPGRRGYPGYMYSDLASLYERAGCIRGSLGSITQIPIITMPDDDMTHPVVDLSGYITEGQIVLDRSLYDSGLYPPVNVLPSLSRLMNKGIGKGKTFELHRALADQLYASYAKARELERLRLIVGDDGLTGTEKLYLGFGREFDSQIVNQGNSARDIDSSIDQAWKCLEKLPRSELYRLPMSYVEEKLGPDEGAI
jgi:V/A-type H+-transporting ATPase subunit B